MTKIFPEPSSYPALSYPEMVTRLQLSPVAARSQLSLGLHVVPTPLGNLGDISLRALVTLMGCDVLACEDTRHTGLLLQHLGLNAHGKKKLLAFHEHNTVKQIPALITLMKQEQIVALVSDAGSPLIADPGRELLLACRAENIPVTILPGPVAAMLAWQYSGLTNEHATFYGFLPATAKARQKELKRILDRSIAAIIYEAPHRILDTLKDISALDSSRTVMLARELTKKFEQIKMGSAAQLHDYFFQHADECRGEMVLVIHPAPPETTTLTNTVITAALKEKKPLGEIAAALAAQTGQSKRDVYQTLLKAKKK